MSLEVVTASTEVEEEEDLVLDEDVLAAIDAVGQVEETTAAEPVAKPAVKKQPKARAKKALGAEAPAKKAKVAAAAGGADDKEASWKKAIVDYMVQQNRPYSSQNVFDNLHGVIPKTQTALLMEKLAEEPGEEGYPPLVMKAFGAAKVNETKIFLISPFIQVFLANQSRFESMGDDTGVEGLQKRVAELQAELDAITS